jgi:integrase
MAKPLTPKEVASKEIKDSEYLVPDVKRLFLRVRPNGKKDWLYIYQWKGARVKMSIKKNSVAEVRALANQYNEWIDVGIINIINNKPILVKTSPKQKLIDDEAERKAQKEKERSEKEAYRLEQQRQLEIESNRISVNTLFERWLQLDIVNRKDGGKEIRRIFEKDVLPLIGNMAVEDVRKSHIMLVIDTLLARGVNRMTKLVLSLMRQMFRFAQDREYIESDPTSSLRKAKIGGKDVVRDRTLSEAEIKDLHSKLPNGKLLKTTECALWIVLSTCCRIGEICKAEWVHLDLNAKTWKIPSDNSKNKKTHTIYLSDFAIKQFEILLSLQNSEKWIYPNSDNTNHVCEKSITKQVGDRQLADDRKPMSGRSKYCRTLKLADGKWTPHDLRRTASTLMGDLGVRPDVIEKCLNHIEQSKMKRTYQHQALIAEQQQAWKLLGDRLTLLTNNNAENVVSMIAVKY